MRSLLLVTVVALMACPSVWAKNEGKGAPHKQAEGSVMDHHGKRAADEVVDAVADEVLDEESARSAKHPSGMPPGLSKKDKMPPGLEKQGKTPEGWSKGEKKGWKGSGDTEEKESLLRRTVRGIFGKGKNKAPQTE